MKPPHLLRVHRPGLPVAGLLCALLLAAALWGPMPALSANTQDEPEIQSIDLAVGGIKVTVKPGGVVALHPDAPFRILKAHTDEWLGSKVTFRMPAAPHADLLRYQSLSDLFGERIWDIKELVIEARKKRRVVAVIRLLPHWLPIDFLRKAEGSHTLENKIRFMRLALEQAPDDRLVVMRLVDLLTEAKEYQQAVALLEEAAKRGDDSKLLSRLAKLYEVLGKKRTHRCRALQALG